MKNKQRIDKGNFDLIFATDDDGHVWVRPSLGWDDGEVYEAFRQRHLIHNALGRVNFDQKNDE